MADARIASQFQLSPAAITGRSLAPANAQAASSPLGFSQADRFFASSPPAAAPAPAGQQAQMAQLVTAILKLLTGVLELFGALSRSGGPQPQPPMGPELPPGTARIASGSLMNGTTGSDDRR